VRPLRLEIEGLASLREKVVVSFEDLDLFAITGPTGAGKSSLIDALVLALYGQVPRVGKEYKQLISHGAERLSVRLDFAVGEAQYRIARTIRASGTPQFRLERLCGGEPEPLADRAKEIEAEIERIVGLDYDAFIRSVVLPQGQFDAFLRGKPEERRKILVALLNLRVYEDMQRIANARAAAAKSEAAFLASQLAQQYAEATPGNLAARQEELRKAEQEREGIDRSLAAVVEALPVATSIRSLRRDLDDQAREVEAESHRLEAANATIAASDPGRRKLAAERARIEAAQAQAGVDGARHVALVESRARAEQLASLAASRAQAEREAAAGSRQLAAKRKAIAAAESGVSGLEQGAQAATEARDAARQRFDELRARHAAHAIRGFLKTGEPCPVCEQVVKQKPKGEAPALGEAEKALAQAERRAEQQHRKAAEARLSLERLRAESAALEASQARLERQQQEYGKAMTGLSEALRAAGFQRLEIAEPQTLVARVRGEIGALEKAQKERQRLETEMRRLETESGELEKATAGAQARAEAARGRIDELKSRRATARKALDDARNDLVTRARKAAWQDVESPPHGRDETDALEARRSASQKDAVALATTVARLTSELRRLEKDIHAAAELTERRAGLERRAALASTLAQHLRADQFLAYVQEEALGVLAEDGSRHLGVLSQGRYALACESQEFFVVDHWNGDQRRSVRTLSGGETFLASLALALALAERLAELSSEGRASEALESLFLDEGFGALDPETLDVVVQAIERLHGGERRVGIVTHIQELAERLPARIEVRRTNGHTTVSIV
jgi:DNA repair protein SbcC/Rad50